MSLLAVDRALAMFGLVSISSSAMDEVKSSSGEALSCLLIETVIRELLAAERGTNGSFVGMSLLVSACVSIRFFLGGGMGGGGEDGQGEPSVGDPVPLEEEIMESDSVSPSSDTTVREGSETLSSCVR